jgi:hypothetical protein
MWSGRRGALQATMHCSSLGLCQSRSNSKDECNAEREGRTRAVQTTPAPRIPCPLLRCRLDCLCGVCRTFP